MTEDGGIILLDSDRGQPFGFTSDRFDGYLWMSDGAITISLIECREPGKGHFRGLVECILDAGYAVKVPTPSVRMRDILGRNGFTYGIEQDPEMGPVEVWTRKPDKSVEKVYKE